MKSIKIAQNESSKQAQNERFGQQKEALTYTPEYVSLYEDTIVKKILKSLEKNTDISICEIGCGGGENTMNILKSLSNKFNSTISKNINILLTDLSEQQLNKVKNLMNTPQATEIIENLGKKGLKININLLPQDLLLSDAPTNIKAQNGNNVFNVVYGKWFLHEVKNDTQAKILEKTVGNLISKNNGYLILANMFNVYSKNFDNQNIENIKKTLEDGVIFSNQEKPASKEFLGIEMNKKDLEKSVKDLLAKKQPLHLMFFLYSVARIVIAPKSLDQNNNHIPGLHENFSYTSDYDNLASLKKTLDKDTTQISKLVYKTTNENINPLKGALDKEKSYLTNNFADYQTIYKILNSTQEIMNNKNNYDKENIKDLITNIEKKFIFATNSKDISKKLFPCASQSIYEQKIQDLKIKSNGNEKDFIKSLGEERYDYLTEQIFNVGKSILDIVKEELKSNKNDKYLLKILDDNKIKPNIDIFSHARTDTLVTSYKFNDKEPNSNSSKFRLKNYKESHENHSNVLEVNNPKSFLSELENIHDYFNKQSEASYNLER